MNWIGPMLLSIGAVATADILTKLTSGRVSPPLGVVLYGMATLTVGLAWVAFSGNWKLAKMVHQPIGLLTGFGVGLAFGVVMIGMYTAYGRGAPISTMSPAVRLGGLFLASLFGLAALGEPLTWRYGLGLAMAAAGVYLVITR